MKRFIDQSTATRLEKAKRVLRSLADAHDYKYFHGDGYPRHAELQQDAAAALQVLEELERSTHNARSEARPACGTSRSTEELGSD